MFTDDLGRSSYIKAKMGRYREEQIEEPTKEMSFTEKRNSLIEQILFLEADLYLYLLSAHTWRDKINNWPKRLEYEVKDIDKYLRDFDVQFQELSESIPASLDGIKEQILSLLSPDGISDTDFAGAFNNELQKLKEKISQLKRSMDSLISQRSFDRIHLFDAVSPVMKTQSDLLDSIPLRKDRFHEGIKRVLGQEGQKKVSAEIIRDLYEESPYAYAYTNEKGRKERVYAGGSPRRILIHDNENASAYEEARAIVASALQAFLEASEVKGNKQGKKDIQILPIKCVILMGSTVYKSQKPSDMDMVILYGKPRFDALDFTKGGISAVTRGVLGEVYDAQHRGEEPKREYTLLGDNLTTTHRLDITYTSEDDFLGQYGHQGAGLQEDLEWQRRTMEERYPQKASSYAKWPYNFEQTIARTNSAVIIYGDSPRDKDGKDIFNLRDDEFLFRE